MRILLILLLGATPLVSSYCNEEKSNQTLCSFKFTCTGNIHDINLPPRCKASSNHQVTVDVTLTNPIDGDDVSKLDLDLESLKYVTSIRVIANWPRTKLTLIQYMPSLQDLYLIGDKINEIDDKAFYPLTNLETIDLSHNNISDIGELFQFDEKNNLKRLSLAHNQIKEIGGQTFEELKSLLSLDLSDNFITDLTEEPFYNLTNLQELRLNNNNIKDLNGAVSNLKNLKHLFLRGNQIQNIDEPSLKVLFHLKTLDLSDNQLNALKPTVLSRHWSHFKGVCKILLAKNHIKSVHNASSTATRFLNALQLSVLVDLVESGQMERHARGLNLNNVDVITELDLSHNDIDEIEYNAFFSLVKLTRLDLSYNNITSFLVNPEHVRFVTYLNLRSNRLTRLQYESFSSMTDLQHIDLSQNNLDFIPEQTFFSNKKLRVVILANNQFEELNTLFFETFDPNGVALDLSGNQITTLIDPIGEGVRLTSLVLNSNKIYELNDIKLYNQKELKMLFLNQNGIRKLNSTSTAHLPKNLRILDISYNEISSIGPSTFVHLVDLEFLNLGHNQLQGVDYGALQGLYVLARLDLSFNKITALDSKVLMDLKNLQELSLQYNGLYKLNYNVWLGHGNVLRVFLEGNNFSCDWLATAIRDYQNGFSKMKPAVLTREANIGNSVENIPCVQKGKTRASYEILDSEEEYLGKKSKYALVDERLLTINKKILESVREQTNELMKLRRSFEHYLRPVIYKINSNPVQPLEQRRL